MPRQRSGFTHFKSYGSRSRREKRLKGQDEDEEGSREGEELKLRETDIRQKDEKSSKNGQNQARNEKAWKRQRDSLNLPDHRIHKDRDGDALFQLKSDSLPHAHAQTTKTYYKHRDSRIMKAQELKTKTSAQTQIYKIFLQRYQVYQGRLLASFQDDAKYEHVGQDTRSQASVVCEEACLAEVHYCSWEHAEHILRMANRRRSKKITEVDRFHSFLSGLLKVEEDSFLDSCCHLLRVLKPSTFGIPLYRAFIPASTKARLIMRSRLVEVEARWVSGVFSGVVVVIVETVIGGNSFALEPGIGTGLIIAGPIDGATDCANMDTIMLRWGSKSSWGECCIAKSRIICDNTNRNTMLSEAQRVSLRITSGMRVEKQAGARLSKITNDRGGVPRIKVDSRGSVPRYPP
ncbi:hypothetical protein Tco_0492607 [Tanacetum coccineum]